MREVMITSKTCRKCKNVERWLQDHPRPNLEILSADTDEGRDLAIKFGVKAAPTLLVFTNGETPYDTVTTLQGDTEIIEFLELDKELGDEPDVGV
jgi:thioredoxin-like negative regulator of GroEL